MRTLKFSRFHYRIHQANNLIGSYNYKKYGSYGSYKREEVEKREAEPEVEVEVEKREAEPEAEVEVDVEKREASPGYATYGDYKGAGENLPSYPSYGTYGAKPKPKPKPAPKKPAPKKYTTYGKPTSSNG